MSHSQILYLLAFLFVTTHDYCIANPQWEGQSFPNVKKQTLYFEQNLDHFNQRDNRTFMQRYDLTGTRLAIFSIVHKENAYSSTIISFY
jgi:hypothetical protein